MYADLPYLLIRSRKNQLMFHRACNDPLTTCQAFKPLLRGGKLSNLAAISKELEAVAQQVKFQALRHTSG